MSTYTPIASQTLSSAATSVTFSSIPQGYTDLVIVSSIAFNNSDSLSFRFNGDTSSSTLYSYTILSGNGSSALSLRGSNQSKGLADYNGFPGSTVGDYNSILQISNYSNSTTFKTAISRGNRASTGTDAIVSLYRSTSPITSITFGMGSAQTQNFAVGSTISLYGIQVGDKTQKAEGGNIVTSDGTYMYHAFTSSGTFTPNEALTADILVVAGGGSGGGYMGGGGGAGGLLTFNSQSLSSISYPCIVGAGGSGNYSYIEIPAKKGNNSYFGNLTAVIGGGSGAGGGGASIAIATSGGSGGGGGTTNNPTLPGASGTAGQGNSGGTSNGLANSSGSAASGGGGAGGAGGNGIYPSTPGNGGVGYFNSLINAMGAATKTGQLSSGNYYYAGGGAGAGGPSSASGGLGGGGNSGRNSTTTGGFISAASSGLPNTGGGGGGGQIQSGTDNGGSGGSGIIIVRYAL